MFDRPGPLDTTGLDGSGALFMPQYKDMIFDEKTIVASPHKVYRPEQNDAALQLRKLRVDQIVLAGMSANLCVEGHMRSFLESEVAVVRDAIAGAKVPEGGRLPPKPRSAMNSSCEALKILYRKGFHTTGMDRLSAETGISKTTMFRHFRTKEDLMLASLRLRDEDFRNWPFRCMEEAGPARAQVVAMFDTRGE